MPLRPESIVNLLPMNEEVILVDSTDRAIGVMPKLQAHENGGVLHRALSVFIFDDDERMLLQKRAMGKYHFPGLWSNACCTHPRPGELTAEAARRRLWEELGIHCPLQHRYVFEYAAACEGGLVENEIDHVFTGQYEGRIRLNPEEVADTRWVTVESLQDEVAMFPGRFTPWMRMALPQVLMVMESGLVKVPSGPTSVRSSTRKDRLESV